MMKMKMEEGWRKNVDFKLSDVGLTYLLMITSERKGSRAPE
jgi:hypothetical protein